VCAAKNIALTEQKQNNLMVLCKCCYGSLKIAEFYLKQNPNLLNKVNKVLAKENLTFKGTVKIKHFLSVLHKDIQCSTLKSHVKIKFKKYYYQP